MGTLNTTYENTLRDILTNGITKTDRTGVGTISSFSHRMEFDLSEGFPLITTKKVYMKGVVGELLWFLRGDTNIQWLQSHNIHIWDEWADENGNLGKVYGYQWRSWERADGTTVDQISEVIQSIKTNPNSRRHIVNAWNVGELDNMALPPCHMMFQFYVHDGKLSCQMYQRSADMFLGVPFNIASYSLLLMMVAQQTGLQPGKFFWVGGDCHIYTNHIKQVEEQLSREPYPFPELKLAKKGSIFDYDFDDVELLGYQSHPGIKAPIAV